MKNCIYCGGLYQNGQGCQWCDENSVYDGTQCVSLKNFIFDSLIGPRNYEYLSKILTSNGNLIVNNQQTLISSCNGSSNGFSCICNSSNQLSSLCN